MAGEMTRQEIRKRELVLGKTPCGFCHWGFGGTREGLGIVTLDLPEAAGQSLGMIGQGLRRRGGRSLGGHALPISLPPSQFGRGRAPSVDQWNGRGSGRCPLLARQPRARWVVLHPCFLCHPTLGARAVAVRGGAVLAVLAASHVDPSTCSQELPVEAASGAVASRAALLTAVCVGSRGRVDLRLQFPADFRFDLLRG